MFQTSEKCYSITFENCRCRWFVSELLTVECILRSGDSITETGLTRIAKEDCKNEVFLEEVGKVRFNQDSDGDFGGGGAKGSRGCE